MKRALLALAIAACHQAESAERAPAPAPASIDARALPPDAAPDATLDATCEAAADATMRIAERELPGFTGSDDDERGRTRAGLIDQCGFHPWDEPERRCMLTAADMDALVQCHRDGDRRRGHH